MENIKYYIEYCARIVELLGVFTIVIGVLLAIIKFILNKQPQNKRSYQLLRQELGKAILLRLEILVAADIVATIVTEPTLNKVFVLAIIVLIRTFLSFSIQMEVEGRLPWKSKSSP